jgi:serine protease Do
MLRALCAGVGGAAVDAGTAALEATQQGFRAIHAKVAPAIVSISSRGVETGSMGGARPFRSSGSGVIIRKEGIVLTNSHVVANSTRVTVKLNDSEKELPAEVVQTDPRTDLAIVRITQKGDYPVATLGDALTVKEGDWAIAFGSPFGLSSTMTVGVISAVNRRIPSPTDEFNYRDLLQTDAAINPGNSGGALVNIRGEVIGINFMIFSPGDSAGSVGIGFAIPVNTFTRQIIDTLVTGKAFQRGQLGVRIGELDNTLREQYGVKDGVFVHEVVPGSAADKAGVKAEDIITVFDGTKVNSADQFVRLVEATKPGTKTTVTVIREKKTQDLTITVGTAGASLASSYVTKLGLTVAAVTPEIAEQLGLQRATGVLVTQVKEGSPAEEADIRRGDVILRVGPRATGTEVSTTDAFWAAVDQQLNAPNAQGVVLLIRRGAQSVIRTLEKPAE